MLVLFSEKASGVKDLLFIFMKLTIIVDIQFNRLKLIYISTPWFEAKPAKHWCPLKAKYHHINNSFPTAILDRARSYSSLAYSSFDRMSSPLAGSSLLSNENLSSYSRSAATHHYYWLELITWWLISGIRRDVWYSTSHRLCPPSPEWVLSGQYPWTHSATSVLSYLQWTQTRSGWWIYFYMSWTECSSDTL